MPNDPLANPAFKPPGFFEKFREDILAIPRPLACAQVEVTSICQGACAYCPREVQRKSWRPRHMQAETFARLWPIMRKSARVHLQGWGEPLLHPRFFDFQKLAAKAGCLTSTTTSGIRMDEELAEKLAESGMDIIAFSLAGVDESTNAIRKNIPFSRVGESIGILRQAIRKSRKEPKLEVHLAYLLLANGIENIRKLPQLMEEWEIDLTVVSTLDYLPAGELRDLAIHPADRDKINHARELLEEAANRAETRNGFIHFSLPEPETDKPGCRENVARNIYIDADGIVSPCVYLNVPGDDPAERRRTYGNVHAEDAWEIWQKQAFRDFRKACLSSSPPEVCQQCPKHWET